MKIVMRSGKKEHWQVVEPVSAKAEAELQELLLDSLSLVPIDEIRDGRYDRDGQSRNISRYSEEHPWQLSDSVCCSGASS